MFAQPAVAAINHLLAQNGWALQRLIRFAGRTARFDIAPFFISCTVGEDGMLRVADAGAGADVRCAVAPSLLPRLAMRDEKAYEEITGEGDPAFLAEILFLAHNLRWDAAEDLSRITGDIAAERIVRAAHGAKQQIGDTVVNLSQAAAEYWTEERPLIARPEQIHEFARQVDALRDDIARLERRANNLPDAGN